MNIITAIVILTVIKYCNGARILGLSPTASYSHQIVFQPLWKELSLRGHQVVVLTANPINDSSLTNLTEIDVHDLSYNLWNKNIAGKVEEAPMNLYSLLSLFFGTMNYIAEKQIEHPEMQALIKNETEHFDLVITEFFYPMMFAFGYRFKCPYISISSLDPWGSVYSQIGSSSHPVLNPDVVLPCEEKLSFLDRFTSVIYTLLIEYIFESYYGQLEQTIENNFGKGYPTIEEMTKNLSILFVNSDQIMYRVRSIPPNVIYIGGGTHIKPTKPLPKDLKQFLDEAKQGCIYFSLGSNVKSKDLRKETLNVILETFSKLPYKILWKFELEKLDGLPKNVMISKWLPQQDVLRHPNIKLFITQGGLQSLEEALHNHIPIVGMPFFGDQESNIKRVVVKGIGLSVDHNTFDKEIFKSTIMEVIDNPKYKNRVKQLSKLVLDEPMKGLERAVWWTEYVIRHNGTEHFRNPAIDIPIYQYYLLDVIGVCLLLVFIVIAILFKLLKIICAQLTNKTKIKKS